MTLSLFCSVGKALLRVRQTNGFCLYKLSNVLSVTRGHI